MLTRKVSPVRCLCYSVSQVLGAVAGAGMVRIMTPALFDQVRGGANMINPGATGQEALGVEFGCTFLLVLTVMAAVDDRRAAKIKHISAIAPIVIGLAVTAGHFVAIPVDNCSINPARSFGVSLVSGSWTDHWIFWFGPYLGSTGAALLYGYVFVEYEESEATAEPGGAGRKREKRAGESCCFWVAAHTSAAMPAARPARFPPPFRRRAARGREQRRRRRSAAAHR